MRGQFTLASGKTSDYYLDCRLTTLDPQGAYLTAHAILDLLAERGIQADAIGGLTMGADPIVTAIAVISHIENKPLRAFIVRRDRKAHGGQKQIEGINEREVSRVVIVDDVCTTGESTMEAIRAAEAAGLQVVAVISLVDREEGGSARLREKYPYFSVFRAEELLEGT